MENGTITALLHTQDLAIRPRLWSISGERWSWSLIIWNTVRPMNSSREAEPGMVPWDRVMAMIWEMLMPATETGVPGCVLQICSAICVAAQAVAFKYWGAKKVLCTNRTQYVVLQAGLQTHIFVSVMPRRGF